MKPKILNVDVAVIGSGTGGLCVSTGLARVGMQILLIEQCSIGGSSLRHGRVPSSTLFYCAKVANILHKAKKIGFDYNIKGLKCGSMRNYISQVVAKIKEKEAVPNLEKQGIKVIVGQAKFLTKNMLKVGPQKVQAKKIIIATGGQHRIPRIPGLKEAGFVTSLTFMENLIIPKDIVILGQDVEAIEYAQAFARFGTAVKVIVPTDTILSKFDTEMMWSLRGVLENEGVEFFTNTQVIAIESNPRRQKKILLCKNNNGDKFHLETQQIFLAAGIIPNISAMQLARAEIAYNDTGIFVDKYFRTNRKNVYAIGDVIATDHKGSHITENQAAMVVNHIALKLPFAGSEPLAPHTVYTDPEYAEVGLTEDMLLAENIKGVDILRSNFRDNERALTMDSVQGKIKILVKKRKILGASILGANASELIAQFSMAIRSNLPIEEIVMNILPYPSLSRCYKKILTEHLMEENLFKVIDKITTVKHKILS